MLKFTLSRMTVDRFFDAVVGTYGPRPCMAQVGQEPFSYVELGRRVEDLCGRLREMGLKRGDHVAFLGPSTPNWSVAFLAVTTLGAVAVPILEEFPEQDINHILHHSDSAAIFIAPDLLRTLDLRHIERDHALLSLEDFSPLGTEARKEGFWMRVKQMFTRDRGPSAGGGDAAEDDLVEILYTSGTTGHSKGVMLTQRSLVSNALAGAEKVVRAEPQDVLLSILPQAHAFGGTCAFLSVLAGGACIYYLDKKPSPKVLLAAMRQVRPTVLAAVPLVFEKIYHKQVLPALAGRPVLRWISRVGPGRALLNRLAGRRILKQFGGRMRCAIIGGAGLNHEVESFLRQAHIPYILGYGLSECAPLVSVAPFPQQKVGSVGPPIPGVEIRIVDPDPSTGVGEILVRGPNVMRGYYKNEEATRAVMVEGGWLDTGDLGRVDREGFLYITGRSKNVIIGSSGENIYPEAVEDLIKDSPFVEEVLVHESAGQVVARIYPDYEYIESRKGTGQEAKLALDVKALLEQVRRETNAKLPPYSRIHRVVEQREPFLKTPTKKIKRGLYLTR